MAKWINTNHAFNNNVLPLREKPGYHSMLFYRIWNYLGFLYTLRTSYIKLVRPFDESSTTYSLQVVDDDSK